MGALLNSFIRVLPASGVATFDSMLKTMESSALFGEMMVIFGPAAGTFLLFFLLSS